MKKGTGKHVLRCAGYCSVCHGEAHLGARAIKLDRDGELKSKSIEELRSLMAEPA